MKKLISTIIIALLPILAIAQIQQGHVKTLGRPENAGKPLSGVTIRQSGAHNAVVSSPNGTFSLSMVGKKLGDSYSLQQVRKDKFELVEQEIIGRKYAYSNSVPLTIVMVSTEQLEKDKTRIENNAYKRAEKDYKTRYTTLEKQLKEKTISEEEYQQEIQALINNFDKYQSMIESLADHYARTDYDALDEREHEINICIENGDLERADSLLHTIDNFDPIEVLKRNKEAMAKFDSQIAQAEEMIAQANADMTEVLRRQEKDAEYLYQLYTIALARYDNEKATQYIKTRAALDTTNVEWQLEAGNFTQKYLANYDKALEYYNCALRNAIKRHGEEHEFVALCYLNIGETLYYQGFYENAQTYYQKALNKSTLINKESLIASCYSRLGNLYNSYGDISNALEFHQRALEIWTKLYDQFHPDVAISYNNIGGALYSQGNYPEALNYFQKALDIYVQVYGKTYPDVATFYNNIGSVLDSQGNYDNALNYHQEALEIRLLVYGEIHPDVATSYNNIGLTLDNQGNYNEALKYYQKALEINLQVFEEKHPNTALILEGIGCVLFSQGRYSDAIIYFLKAIKIEQHVYGEMHPSVATSYNNIGNAYCFQGNYPEALKYFQKALKISKQIYNEDHPTIATSYNCCGIVYYNLGYYNEALEAHLNALEIFSKIFGHIHPDVASCYNNIGNIYSNLTKYSESLTYYNMALEIGIQLLGKDHPNVQTVKQSIEFVKSKIAESQK